MTGFTKKRRSLSVERCVHLLLMKTKRFLLQLHIKSIKLDKHELTATDIPEPGLEASSSQHHMSVT